MFMKLNQTFSGELISELIGVLHPVATNLSSRAGCSIDANTITNALLLLAQAKAAGVSVNLCMDASNPMPSAQIKLGAAACAYKVVSSARALSQALELDDADLATQEQAQLRQDIERYEGVVGGFLIPTPIAA
jgi:hypothetical protein